MKVTKNDFFPFFSSLFLTGVGMLQPLNPILGYTLVIIGIAGMVGVLIRAGLRKQNNAQCLFADCESLLSDIYSLYNETGLFIESCYVDDRKTSGNKLQNLHNKFENYLNIFKGKTLRLPQELELKMSRLFDILFEYKRNAEVIASAAKTPDRYTNQQKLEQKFTDEVPVLYSEIEVELRKLLNKSST